MQPISYARHQFPPEVIRRAVWLYLRFTLSYRDVEELLAERGLDVLGVDLSPRCVELARAERPGLRFEVLDQRAVGPAALGGRSQ